MERAIGSILRECFDHLIVLNEGHLLRSMRPYLSCYPEGTPLENVRAWFEAARKYGWVGGPVAQESLSR